MALTVAAGLSIAAEHARSSPAAALGAPLALRGHQGAGDGGSDGKVAGDKAAPQAKSTAAGSPGVGSRALTGNEEVRSKMSRSRAPADRAPE
jgi:hypothetical protein